MKLALIVLITTIFAIVLLAFWLPSTRDNERRSIICYSEGDVIYEGIAIGPTHSSGFLYFTNVNGQSMQIRGDCIVRRLPDAK